MGKHLFDLPDRQSNALRELKDRTGSSVTDLVKGMIEQGLKTDNLNISFPTMSGRILSQQYKGD